MNKKAIFAAIFALCIGASQTENSWAQDDGPIQAPIDGGPITAPVPNPNTTPDNPDGGTVLNVIPRAADQYSEDEIKALGQGPAFPYSLLESALKKGVTKEGSVNYNVMQLNNELSLFVRAVGLADMTQFPVFKETDEDGKVTENRKSELTFWINSYNGLFLKAVATGYPIKQLSQIKDLQTAKTRVVGGKNYSFPEIRTKIAALDGRALFALVDGTIYGPRVSQYAYRSYGLGAQLNESIKNFVSDPVRVPVPDRLGKTINISPWLQSIDPYFKAGGANRKWSGLKNLLTSYAPNTALRNYYGAGDYEIKFLPATDAVNDTINNVLSNM